MKGGNWAFYCCNKNRFLICSPPPSPPFLKCQESLHVCKLYNRLATALLKYEALWLGQWRSSIKHARAGLKATLLVQEEEGGGATRGSRIRVNAHDRYVAMDYEILGNGDP